MSIIKIYIGTMPPNTNVQPQNFIPLSQWPEIEKDIDDCAKEFLEDLQNWNCTSVKTKP